MSAYVVRQLRILGSQPKRINLLKRMPAPLMASGFTVPGFRLLSAAAIQRLPVVRLEENHPGVYLLWLGKTLQYIGSSQTVAWRVKEHRKNLTIAFDKATYMRVAFPWYLSVEAAYMAEYLPPANIRFGHKRRYKSAGTPDATGTL